MKPRTICALFAAIIIISGCRTSRQDPKYQLSDGYYHGKLFNPAGDLVYINNTEDTVTIISVERTTRALDTSGNFRKTFPQRASYVSVPSVIFRQSSFDIDFLTIPFKYRPAKGNLPKQFNTNLNGAVYVGRRIDFYQIRYKKQPLTGYNRETQHYGFSYGVFTGLGGTTINPSTTGDQLVYEYDGVVWSKGLAAIIAINSFTIGLAFGYDNLLDNNKKYWFYEGKPWVGLAFGLNIN